MTFTPVAKGFDLLHNIDTDPPWPPCDGSVPDTNAVRRDDGQRQVNDLRFRPSARRRGQRLHLPIRRPRARRTVRVPTGPRWLSDDTAETMMRTLVKRACIKAPAIE